jgi:hypothetical protein
MQLLIISNRILSDGESTPMENIAYKLPEELRAKYQTQACVCVNVVERLKVAAALKLWFNRSYRDIEFSVPLALGRKKFFVDVLAKRADGVVGVECVPSVNLGWLRERMALLRRSFPSDGYFVIVFPSTVGKQVDRATFLADEVWVTDETNSKVASMMFVSTCHKK